MLWLPKWLKDNEPVVTEGVSRRAFLFLGAAAAVGAVLPAPLDGWQDRLWVASADQARLYQGARRGGKTHLTLKHLYARIRLSDDDLRASATQQGAFFAACREETAEALADVEASAVRAGFVLASVPGEWSDKDGKVLRWVKGE